MPQKIRVVALCIFRRNDEILVGECRDAVTGESFYRPLGGKVEFGERGSDAAEREIREEIGAETENLRYLGLKEALFTYEGTRRHEIALIFQGEFCDKSLYQEDCYPRKDKKQTDRRAVWKPIAFFGNSRVKLYPADLLDLIH